MTSQPAIAADISQGLVGAAVLVSGCVLCVLFLRIAGYRWGGGGGRAIVAGVIAGMLLGPTVFDRVFPDRFQSMFVGGVKQQAELDYARWLARTAPTAIPNLTEEARQSMREQAAEEIAAKQAALDALHREHRRPLHWLTMGLVALVLIRPARSGVGQRDRRQRAITPVSIGLWSFALPGAAAYIACMQWWESSRSEAAIIAACVGVGPWMLRAAEREAADGAEFGGARMMQTAGRLASTLAIALAIGAAWFMRGLDGVLLMCPLIVLPIAWILGMVTSTRAEPVAESESKQDRCGWLFEIALASLAAILCMHIDLHRQLDWIMLAMVVVLGLIADDARWAGAFLGAMLLGGRPALRTLRLTIPAMAAGPTQLALAALAIQAMLVPDRFALPLLAGVLLMELTAPLRSGMAARLIEVEREVDDLQDHNELP